MIADAKRGDVPGTAAAYAQALSAARRRRSARAGLGADAVTANPLLGRDALEPLVAGARERGAGVFVLVRTSNPGAADVFDLELATGGPLWERIAAAGRASWARPGESGLADVGAVTGATAPEHLARMRELMPRTPVPAARHRRPGRRRRGARAGVRPGPGGGPRERLALDRGRPRGPRRRPRAGRARRGRAAARGGVGARLAALEPRWSRRSAAMLAAMAGRSPARFLAPLALVAFASPCSRRLGRDEDDGRRTARPTPLSPRATATATPDAEAAKRKRKVVLVKAGDTPSGIAEKTGRAARAALELNPDLDPQLLAPGQRIKLAE